MKICCKCKLEKDEVGFHKNKNRKDGLNPVCKICKKIYSQKYDRENREKKREKCQKWRLENKDKTKEHSKRDREKNHEKIIARKRTAEAREKMRLAVNNWNHRNLEKARKYRKDAKIKNKDRNCARLKIMNEIRRGRMIRPSICEKCMKECKPDGHHIDYSKPLEVQWLCKICHKKEHGKLLDVAS